MTFSSQKRLTIIAVTASFASIMALGCSKKQEDAQPQAQVQTPKPGTVSYPPNMRLGADGKPVRLGSQ